MAIGDERAIYWSEEMNNEEHAWSGDREIV